ncbi:MAG: aldo/keto reductase [Bryobacterales bacterium]|nr:aldo/keto reductase [Bryobacterales bacterium]
MKRRVFVGASLATSAVRPVPAAVKAGDIPMRVFGKTGQKLTVIGQAGGRFPLISFPEAVAVTRRAVELGINYFDNARVYWDGKSEEVYGEALKDVRKKVFITTKAVGRTKKDAEEQLHQSLRALRTDYVDLWQMHSLAEPEDVDKIFGPGGAIEAFESAKKAGKCRFFGFTGHKDPHVHAAMLKKYQHYDTILMPLHAADPSYLSFEKIVLPEAVKRGMGIQGMKNFANAKLLSMLSARECLSYVLSLPIHCTAIGCTTIGQLEDDVRIAQQFKPFSETQMAELRDRASKIKGPNTEDWKRNIEVRAGLDPRPEYLGG